MSAAEEVNRMTTFVLMRVALAIAALGALWMVIGAPSEWS
jgi:hypothetical protein